MSFRQKHLGLALGFVVGAVSGGCGVVPDGTGPSAQRLDASIVTTGEAGSTGGTGGGGGSGAVAGSGGAGGQATDAGPLPDGGRDVMAPADTGPPTGWSGPPLVVAVGYGGRRLVSVDGVVWTGDMQDLRGNADSPRLLRDVSYGGGLVVAVGGGCSGGTACSGRILTFNGDRWAEATVPSGQGWLSGVVHGGGTWVAVGANGSILYSKDGKSWTAARPQMGNLRRVAHGNVGGTNMFVAVGDNGLRVRSLDGIAWSDAVTGFPGADGPVSLTAVGIGNGTVVAAGDAGRRIRSRNGVVWTDAAAGGSGIGAVVFVDGRLMAFDDPVVHVSTDDGARWSPQTQVNPPSDSVAVGMLRGSRLFVGARGAEIKTSPNGVAWTTRVNGGMDLNNITAFTFAGF